MGWLRLAAAFFVAWSLAWGWVYFDNKQRVASLNAQLGRTDSLQLETTPYELLTPDQKMWRAMNNDSYRAVERAQEWEGRAIAIWTGGLVAAAIATGAGLWVWRGFRPKTPKGQTSG